MPTRPESALSQIHAPFVVAALLLAIGVGLLSGIGVALNRLGVTPWGDAAILTSAHQVAQTWGFVGLFITGMTFRLLPLWTRTRLRMPRLASVILIAICLAVLGNALLLPGLSEEWRSRGDIAVAGGLLVASFVFALIVGLTLASRSSAARRPPWAFLAGAILLVVAGCLRFAVALSDGYYFWIRSAETLVFLGGFIPAFVASAAARGFRAGHWGEGVLAVCIGAATLAVALLLIYLDTGGQSKLAVRLTGVGFICLAAIWTSVPVLSGVFAAAASRTTGSWPHLLLVRSAFTWMFAAGLIGLWAGGGALVANDLPQSSHLDVINHALGFSALTLIVGMGLLLLPDFARVHLRSAASTMLASALLVLLNLAAFARIGTALGRGSVNPELLAGAQVLAGILAETALIAFAAAMVAARLSGYERRAPRGPDPV